MDSSSVCEVVVNREKETGSRRVQLVSGAILATVAITTLLYVATPDSQEGRVEGAEIKSFGSTREQELQSRFPYFFRVTPGNFWQVKHKCEAEGAVLASIHSSAEARAARRACGHNHCYIGLARNHHTRRFEWLDKTPFSYAAWDRGQPQAHETKVVFTNWRGKRWHDWGHGHARFWGVCKKNKPWRNEPGRSHNHMKEEPHPNLAQKPAPAKASEGKH